MFDSICGGVDTDVLYQPDVKGPITVVTGLCVQLWRLKSSERMSTVSVDIIHD